MVGFTTLLYAYIGFQWDVNLFLKTAVSSIFAVSNLYLLQLDSEYFHQDLTNPLLHTWSLGVEEQFYLFYPFLLVGLIWVGKTSANLIKLLIATVVALCLLSLIVFLNNISGWSDFYSPIARFWEIGIGCVLFFLSQKIKYHHKLFSYVGIILVFIPVFLGGWMSFKIEVVLAVIGTALFIFGGLYTSSVVKNIFSHDFTVYFGKISYSLYLWHMPVIYFLYLYADGYLYYLMSIVLSVMCAACSYHFIEKPLRFSRSFEVILYRLGQFTGRAIATVLFAAIVISPGEVRAAINQSFNHLEEKFHALNYIESTFSLGDRIAPNYTLSGEPAVSCSDPNILTKYSKNELGLYEHCYKNGSSTDLFYLTGDSHSFHFLSAFDNASVVKNLYFVEVPRQRLVT